MFPTPQSPLTTLVSVSPLPLLAAVPLLALLLHLAGLSSDLAPLSSLGLTFAAAPLLAQLLGHGLATLPLLGLGAVVQLTGHLLAAVTPASALPADLAVSRYPPLVAALLAALSAVTCGGLGLVLGGLLFTLHLSLLYRRHLASPHQQPQLLASIHTQVPLNLYHHHPELKYFLSHRKYF